MAIEPDQALRAICALGLSLILAGCGGGSDNAGPEAAAASTPDAASPTQVVADTAAPAVTASPPPAAAPPADPPPAAAAPESTSPAPSPAPPAPVTFKQRAAALAADAAGIPAGEPDAAALAEARQRALEWASRALAGKPGGSAVAVPALYFGLAFAVDAAARGDTRAALREVVAPASPQVQALLQRGLERTVYAVGDSVFLPEFLDALTAQGQPGTWAQLSLQPMPSNPLLGDPNLRMQVDDSVSVRWTWPAARAYDGVQVYAAGSLKVSMVEVQGPMLTQQGAGYEVSSLALPGGHWLVRVVPETPLGQWDAAAVAAAVAQVLPTLTAKAAAAAAQGQWRLPLTSADPVGLDDRRGMTLALDRLNADLRGLDGGGTHLVAAWGRAGLAVSASDVRYWGAQSFSFLFDPSNRFSAGAGFVDSTWRSPPPCPTEPADLRPYLLAHVQPGGTVAVLARMQSHDGEICSS